MSDDIEKRQPFPWSRIQQDLRSALDHWDLLDRQLGETRNPEEEKLAELRRLLTDLEAKIRDF